MKKILLLILILVIPSFAVLKKWSATSNGNWGTAGNWTPSGVPAVGDSVVFDNTSIFRCFIDAATNEVGALNVLASYTTDSGVVVNNGYLQITPTSSNSFRISGKQVALVSGYAIRLRSSNGAFPVNIPATDLRSTPTGYLHLQNVAGGTNTFNFNGNTSVGYLDISSYLSSSTSNIYFNTTTNRFSQSNVSAVQSGSGGFTFNCNVHFGHSLDTIYQLWSTTATGTLNLNTYLDTSTIVFYYPPNLTNSTTWDAGRSKVTINGGSNMTQTSTNKTLYYNAVFSLPSGYKFTLADSMKTTGTYDSLTGGKWFTNGNNMNLGGSYYDVDTVATDTVKDSTSLITLNGNNAIFYQHGNNKPIYQSSAIISGPNGLYFDTDRNLTFGRIKAGGYKKVQFVVPVGDTVKVSSYTASDFATGDTIVGTIGAYFNWPNNVSIGHVYFKNFNSVNTIYDTLDFNQDGGGNTNVVFRIPQVTILSQPTNQTCYIGQTSTFTISVAYQTHIQWYLGATPIAGANSTTYTTPICSTVTSKSYSCKVNDAIGDTLTSNTVTNTSSLNLSISSQPTDNWGLPNSNVVFSVTSSSNNTLSYQWYKNNSLQSGKTASKDTALNIQSTNNLDSFYVKIFDVYGDTLTSNVVHLYYITSITGMYVSTTGSDANVGSISSPLATITKAAFIISKMGTLTSNDTVWVRGGTYYKTSVDTFKAAWSGTGGHKIVYKAYPSETPIFNGGQVISGWSLYDAGKNIYRSNVGTSIDSRQLYVNGIRCVRARGSGSGWAVDTNVGFIGPVGKTYADTSSVEIMYSQYVTQCRVPIASQHGDTFVIKQPAWNNFKVARQYIGVFNYLWIENAYELLDSVSEWYLDRSAGYLYYKPRVGEDLSTAVVTMPVSDGFFFCQNDSNLSFEGLNFNFATWLHPNTGSGYIGLGGGNYLDSISPVCTTKTWWYKCEYLIPSSFTMYNSKNITINNCRFEHIGGQGIGIGSYCKNDTINHSVINDISAGGIIFGAPYDFDSLNPAIGIGVVYDSINSTCLDFWGTIGVLGRYNKYSLISHNTITNSTYIGFAMGASGVQPTNLTLNDEVSYNRIHHFCTQGGYQDGGGLYVNCYQPGLKIHDNFIGGPSAVGLAGQSLALNALYLDNYSSGMNVYKNVVDSGKFLFPINGDSADTVHNNYFNVLSYISWYAMSKNCYEYLNDSLTRGELWATIPRQIVDSSGVTPFVSMAITSQPSSASIPVGSSTTFSVSATSNNLPITYQWQDSVSGAWVNVGGATASSYTFTPTLSLSGLYYRCILTDIAGSINSSKALLTVTTPSLLTSETYNTLLHKLPGVEYSGNPIISYTPSTWKGRQVHYPKIIQDPWHNDSLIMYYGGGSYLLNNYNIGMSKTDTGHILSGWHDYASNPLLTLPTTGGSPTGSFVLGVQHVMWHPSTSELWLYCTVYNSGANYSWQGLFKSSNGTTFSYYGAVIDTSGGETMVGDAGYIQDSTGKYFCYYTYRTASATLPGIKLATSTDGTTWTKQGVVLTHGTSQGVYDSTYIEGTQILKTSDKVALYYNSYNGSTNANGRWTCSFATSDSFMGTFVKEPNNPVFTAGGAMAWDSQYVSTAYIYSRNSADYHFWQGTPTTGNYNAAFWNIGCAPLVSPVTTPAHSPKNTAGFVSLDVNHFQVLEPNNTWQYQWKVPRNSYVATYCTSAVNINLFHADSTKIPRWVRYATDTIYIYANAPIGKQLDSIYYMGFGLKLNEKNDSTIFNSYGFSHYFPFDEGTGATTKDIVTNVNDTVISPATVSTKSNFYYGLSASASTSGVKATSEIVGTGSKTMEFTFNLSDSTTIHRLLDNGKVYIYFQNPSTINYYSNGSSQVPLVTNVTKNQWHHMTVIQNGTNVSCMYDGIQTKSSTASGGITAGTTNTYIGRDAAGTYAWSGLLDNVGILNSVVTNNTATERYKMLINPLAPFTYYGAPVYQGDGPTINTQPSAVSVNSGSTATFNIVATSSSGGLVYQWADSTAGSWTNVGTNSSAYSFTASGSQNGYYYRCTVSDDHGNIVSTKAKLTVTSSWIPIWYHRIMR